MPQCIIDYNLVLLACCMDGLDSAQAAPSFRLFISAFHFFKKLP